MKEKMNYVLPRKHKPDFTNEPPKHVVWGLEPNMFALMDDDFASKHKGTYVEECPSCHEYLQACYEDEDKNVHCYFCGQILLPPKQRWVTRREVIGFVEKDGGEFCSVCGKRVESVNPTFHGDGPETYVWGGHLGCGHTFEIVTYRDQGSWEDVDPSSYEFYGIEPYEDDDDDEFCEEVEEELSEEDIKWIKADERRDLEHDSPDFEEFL